MQKGYAYTAGGRCLVAQSLATKTPIIWTRAAVGEGRPAEDTELATMTELVRPVMDSVMSVPEYKRDRVYITVEHRSDMNEAIGRGINVTEFGIYAKCGDDGEETLVVYGCQGDYPVWIGPYILGNRDIRRWPVTIAIGEGVSMDIGYSPGMFMTAEDIDRYAAYVLLPALAAQSGTIFRHDITVPVSIWAGNDASGWTADKPVADIYAAQTPIALVDDADFEIVEACGLSEIVDSRDGGLVFRSEKRPTAEIHVVVLMLQPSGSGDIPVNGGFFAGAGGTGAPYDPEAGLLPATQTRLGGIMVGDNLDVTRSGVLSVSKNALSSGSEFATDEDVRAIVDEVLGDDSKKEI